MLIDKPNAACKQTFKKLNYSPDAVAAYYNT